MKYQCEKCGTEYDLTEEHLGVPLECQCGHKFTVPAPAPAPAAPSPDPAQNPNLMACPDCGAMVSKKATACPKCGSPFQKAAAAPSGPSGGSDRPIRVDTGENVLNRNRGCGDILIYSPLLIILFVIIFAMSKGCAQ